MPEVSPASGGSALDSFLLPGCEAASSAIPRIGLSGNTPIGMETVWALPSAGAITRRARNIEKAVKELEGIPGVGIDRLDSTDPALRIFCGIHLLPPIHTADPGE